MSSVATAYSAAMTLSIAATRQHCSGQKCEGRFPQIGRSKPAGATASLCASWPSSRENDERNPNRRCPPRIAFSSLRYHPRRRGVSSERMSGGVNNRKRIPKRPANHRENHRPRRTVDLSVSSSRLYTPVFRMPHRVLHLLHDVIELDSSQTFRVRCLRYRHGYRHCNAAQIFDMGQ
jgi:hypothetical protein